MSRVRLSAARRRRQLLEVAGGLFGELGYHGLSMDRLADAAGVSKPVLYQHFPGKRELYLALVRDAVAELQAQVQKALAMTSDNRTRVYGAIRAYVDATEDRRSPLLLAANGPSDDDATALVAAAHEQVSADVAALIAEDAGLGTDGALLLSHALRGLATEGARWLGENPQVDRAEGVRLLSRLAWRGIGGFGPEGLADVPRQVG